jgi:serine phosphatase RsbU (regulator of sigma subunit)
MQADEFLAMLEGRPSADHDPLPAAVVIALGTLDHAWTVDRLVEALQSRNIPGIFLLPNPDDWRPFQRHGIIFERHDADPRQLAAMLYALAERQSSVDLLQRELFVAQRAQGGFRVEMDRMHEELHMAATVQRDFIPAVLPTIPGLDLACVFRPVNYVSGDIYHIEQLNERTVGFFIADAVGHGVPAALLTMVLAHNLTTSELQTDDGVTTRRLVPPSRVLASLNDRLCSARSIHGRFATAVYGTIDTITREITLAGAGHPPPMVLSHDESRAIETLGPLLGVFPDATFPEVTLTLRPGDTFLLYSDGLEAAFNVLLAKSATRRDADRYMDQVSRLFVSGASTLRGSIDDLHSLLDEQAGSLHQCDDVTALAIRPLALAAEVSVRAAA